jgi:hypothetical protein
MIKVEIGTTVDFIHEHVRCRGVIHGIQNGLAAIPVIGDASMYNIPLTSVTPVKNARDFLNVLKS